MRVASIISESIRNIVTGTTRAVLFASLLGVATGGFVLADALTVMALQTRAAAYVQSGAATRVLQAVDAIDGGACDGITGDATITASGGLRAAEDIGFLALPTTTIPAYEVTAGLIGLLGGDADKPGVWLSATLADTLAVGVGGSLSTIAGTLTVAGVYEYPEDGRDSRLAYAILLPTIPERDYDECWATAWPQGDGTDLLLRSVAYAGPGSTDALQIGQLNKTSGVAFDPQTLFDARITRFAYPLIAVVAAGLGWAGIRTRRLEQAAALHAGQRRPEQILTVGIETTAWAFLGCILAMLIVTGALIAVGAAGGAPEDPLATPIVLIPIVGPAFVVAICAPFLGAVLASLTTRERHLFRYFKERS